MERVFRFMLGIAGSLAGAFLVFWFVWRTIKKAEDPARVLFKWIVTAVVFVLLVGLGISLHSSGYAGAFGVPIAAAAFGVFLGILWAPHLGALLASGFTSFYDGGSQQVEERPFYAIARAKQKRGNYPEAIAEIRKQLHRFPEDYEGWMLLAEIYAEDLKDNQNAQNCIEEIVGHGTHAPKNVTFALNRAADWYLKLVSDREAARQCLEQIIALYPGTECAHTAEQRAAHLTTDQMLAEQKERPRLVLTHHDEYIGLRGEIADPRPPAEEPPAAAARLVQRLTEFPQDVEAREELAKVYADHYKRLDLATEQFEQLIATPGAAQKEITRWLNMLADLHLKVEQAPLGAEKALRRIIELFPGSAAAAQAENRVAYLGTELLKNRTSQALKLGSYEVNIGLRGGPAKPGP